MVYRMNIMPMLEEYGKDLRLSPLGILKLFENAGTRHSAAVGDSLGECLARGEAWLLTDWYVEIYTRVPLGLEVRVETFCRKSERTSALLRDFRMRDEEGNLIALATSKWAKVSIEDNRILRVDDDVFEQYDALTHSVLGELPPPPRHGSLPILHEKEITLRRGDFDMYEHVHNLHYLDYAFEAIPEEVYTAHGVRAFHIAYIKAITQGQRVLAKCAETEGGYAVFIEADGMLAATVDLFVPHPPKNDQEGQKGNDCE